MKKIFAISFLSLMAVTGGARAEVQQYNLNLATAEYVEDVRDELSDLIYSSVHASRVAESGETVAEASKDYYIPTVARVDAAIEDAVAGVDTSGLVEKTQIVTSAEGQAVSVYGEEGPVSEYSLAVQGGDVETEESMDSAVASVNTVAEHFVPSGAVEYRDDYHGINEIAMRPGLYTIMVGVDDKGNKTFIWQAVQEDRHTSSVGGAMPI